jgi:beta-lactamase superfamily II metal-dependent hydrolase
MRKLAIYFVYASIALAFLAASISAATLEIHCLDVDQGDCTLVVSSSGQALLMDAGKTGYGSGKVVPYLGSLGITSLTYMVASHYHFDHIGGLDEVIDAGIPIDGACYDRGWSYTTVAYQDYEDAVAPYRATIYDGQVLDLGDGVTATCVTVNGNGVLSSPFEQPPHNENDLSVGLVISLGDFEFFVAGDLSGANTSSYSDIETSVGLEVGDIEVYRVDHHGSAFNSNQSFVDDLEPEVSVFSVGSNSYGHPTQTVINRLINAGSYLYLTNEGDGGTVPTGDGEVVNGDVVISTDGIQTFNVNGDEYEIPGATGFGPIVADVEKMQALRAYPNPFNPATSIVFMVTAGNPTDVEVFDASGSLVRTLFSGSGIHGAYEVGWDGTDNSGARVASGTYFCRVTTGDSDLTTKLVLAK